MVEHASVIGGEAVGVVASRDVVAGDRIAVEEQREHAAHSCDLVVDVGIGGSPIESIDEARGGGVELRVGVVFAEHLERGQSTGHRQGVPRESPGLVDGSVG